MGEEQGTDRCQLIDDSADEEQNKAHMMQKHKGEHPGDPDHL